MTDAEQLRDLAETLDACEWCHPLGSGDLCRRVADEIGRLRAENAVRVRELQDEIDFLRTLIPPHTLEAMARKLDEELHEGGKR